MNILFICTHIISLWWRVLYSTKYFNRKYELMCINCLNVPVFFEGKTLAAQNRFCILIYLVTSKQTIFNSLSFLCYTFISMITKYLIIFVTEYLMLFDQSDDIYDWWIIDSKTFKVCWDTKIKLENVKVWTMITQDYIGQWNILFCNEAN